jgi:protein-S-isoprenylcysteine O-methyltransferase Ste14
VSVPWLVIRAAWLVLVLYWIAAWRLSARHAKRTERSQAAAGQWGNVAALVLTAGIIAFGPRSLLYLPSVVVQWIGAVLAILGCVLAVAARAQLGANWSPHATLKANQDLIQTGAYSVTRHPIYTGILTLLAASALALGELRVLIAFVILAYSFHQKAKAEEALMQDHFGVAYANYRLRVKRLVPLLW